MFCPFLSNFPSGLVLFFHLLSLWFLCQLWINKIVHFTIRRLFMACIWLNNLQYCVMSVFKMLFTLNLVQQQHLKRLKKFDLLSYTQYSKPVLSFLLSFQIVVLRMMTVWMGIGLQPRLPSRSPKFPRSLQSLPLHAGPVLLVAS